MLDGLSTHCCLFKLSNRLPCGSKISIDVVPDTTPDAVDLFQPVSNSNACCCYGLIVVLEPLVFVHGCVEVVDLSVVDQCQFENRAIHTGPALWRDGFQAICSYSIPCVHGSIGSWNDSVQMLYVIRIYWFACVIKINVEQKVFDCQFFVTDCISFINYFCDAMPQCLCRGNRCLAIVRLQLTQKSSEGKAGHASGYEAACQALVSVCPKLPAIEDKHVLLLRDSFEHLHVAKARLKVADNCRKQKQKEPDKKNRQRPVDLLHLVAHPPAGQYRWRATPVATGACG